MLTTITHLSKALNNNTLLLLKIKISIFVSLFQEEPENVKNK